MSNSDPPGPEEAPDPVRVVVLRRIGELQERLCGPRVEDGATAIAKLQALSLAVIAETLVEMADSAEGVMGAVHDIEGALVDIRDAIRGGS